MENIVVLGSVLRTRLPGYRMSKNSGNGLCVIRKVFTTYVKTLDHEKKLTELILIHNKILCDSRTCVNKV